MQSQFDIWFSTTQGVILRQLSGAAALIFMDKVHYPMIQSYTFLHEDPIITAVHALIHGCLYGQVNNQLDYPYQLRIIYDLHMAGFPRTAAKLSQSLYINTTYLLHSNCFETFRRKVERANRSYKRRKARLER